jgi:hypothetical protein
MSLSKAAPMSAFHRGLGLLGIHRLSEQDGRRNAMLMLTLHPRRVISAQSGLTRDAKSDA